MPLTMHTPFTIKPSLNGNRKMVMHKGQREKIEMININNIVHGSLGQTIIMKFKNLYA